MIRVYNFTSVKFLNFVKTFHHLYIKFDTEKNTKLTSKMIQVVPPLLLSLYKDDTNFDTKLIEGW